MNEMCELSKKSEYYISKNRYLELKNFCLQYREWKQELSNINLMAKANDIRVDHSMSDPVSNITDIREPLLRKITLVETCCAATDKDLACYILLGVTRHLTYENLRVMHCIPCNRRDYYNLYRKFFYILSQKRG